MLLFPMFGLAVTLRQNLVIGLVFTGVSIARSYLLRRAFEAMRWWLPLSGLGRVADGPPAGRAAHARLRKLSL